VSQRGNEIRCINFNKGLVIWCHTFMLNALDHKVFHSHFQIILLKDDTFRINRNNTQSSLSCISF